MTVAFAIAAFIAGLAVGVIGFIAFCAIIANKKTSNRSEDRK